MFDKQYAKFICPFNGSLVDIICGGAEDRKECTKCAIYKRYVYIEKEYKEE